MPNITDDGEEDEEQDNTRRTRLYVSAEIFEPGAARGRLPHILADWAVLYYGMLCTSSAPGKSALFFQIWHRRPPRAAPPSSPAGRFQRRTLA